ncbi:MAG: DUF4252 domain-containing protein [Melioribacteraceae bacterium]|nr:DUF4252 domain-containing protein [Melioribacteraceae bacterium]MCF8356057.1 DUF4252 domain-containing protein [Melioribacteraceae bacterium]MCF8394884.1 DUF4252 domain-containing protein [Melioribacteraceae bacterium]MCF8420417.1 DUF4252 domain-containing protein [Melioribacteraceae bacterium]
MKKNKIKFIVIALGMSLLLSGCIMVNADFREARNTILNSIDGEFNKEIEFAVGGGMILMARMFIPKDEPDAEIAQEALENISSVQVGIYSVKGHLDYNRSFVNFKNQINNMLTDEWECIVKAFDHSEQTAVFVKCDEDKIRSMFVIALNNDELVLAEVNGDLEELIAVAVRQSGLELGIRENM